MSANLNMMLFFGWLATGHHNIPWFVFVLLPCLLALGVHVYFHHKQNGTLVDIPEEPGIHDGTPGHDEYSYQQQTGPVETNPYAAASQIPPQPPVTAGGVSPAQAQAMQQQQQDAQPQQMYPDYSGYQNS